MKINFGYVAMSNIVKDCSPSKTITAANLKKIPEEVSRQHRLTTITKINIYNTQRLLYHNDAHDIKIYRLTSRLIPLATHPITNNWDWYKEVQEDLQSLGKYAQEKGFRISAHPDHFTLLNSPKEDVIAASIRDLEYHHKIFSGMGLSSSAKLVLHVGGQYSNKKLAIEAFLKNFSALPSYLKNRIILENDDKIYTIKDVLNICQLLRIPMVLDIHHHWCHNEGENIEEYLPLIFATWNNESIPPKIHLSSPKDKKNFRHHADYVDVNFFLEFLKAAKKTNRDFDVVIEAKNKDDALFKLMNDLKSFPHIKLINQASIEV